MTAYATTEDITFVNTSIYARGCMVHSRAGFILQTYTTTVTTDVNQQPYFAPTGVLVFAAVVIIPIILITLVGNLLTIVAFLRDKELHQSINIYILNLAGADFFIGLLIMPIYLIYTLKRSVWVLGQTFCKVFLLCDQIFTGVSVILIILISYDRLMLLRHWSRNYKTQTRKKAYARSGLAWIIVLFAFGPATLFWDVWTGKNSVTPNDCTVQYVNNTAYNTVLAVLAFPFPFIVLSILNVVIFINIKKLMRTSAQLSNISSLSNSHESSVCFDEPRREAVKHLHGRNSQCAKESFQVKKIKKAAKALVVLLFVFVITWAPYAIVVIVRSICALCVSVPVEETCIWILWFKSAINPFIYALNCNRFRANFKQLLYLKQNQLFRPRRWALVNKCQLHKEHRV